MAKKKRSFAWAPTRKLMKKSGLNLVARNAVDTMIQNNEDIVTSLTKKALGFAKHAKRKKITKDDIGLAIKFR